MPLSLPKTHKTASELVDAALPSVRWLGSDGPKTFAPTKNACDHLPPDARLAYLGANCHGAAGDGAPRGQFDPSHPIA